MLNEQQLQSLTTELQKPVYASYASSGDYNSIVNLLNAQYPTGNHYISRVLLKNILTTNGIYNELLLASITPSSPMYQQAVIFIKNIDSPDYPQFRLENPVIQSFISTAVASGLMTSQDVQLLESQFTPEMTSIAQNILSRAATLDDVNQVLGTPLLTQIQTAISYATAKSATVLQPLYEAWQTKQASFQQYIQTLQQVQATLLAGNPAQVPTNAEIDTIIQ